MNTIAMHVRVGDVIIEPVKDHARTKYLTIKTIDLGSCKNHVHINGMYCYDNMDIIAIRREP